MTRPLDIIEMRKRKKDLYITLLTKGLKYLTPIEKKILEYLSQDDDINLMLSNGTAFEIQNEQMI